MSWSTVSVFLVAFCLSLAVYADGEGHNPEVSAHPPATDEGKVFGKNYETDWAPTYAAAREHFQNFWWGGHTIPEKTVKAIAGICDEIATELKVPLLKKDEVKNHKISNEAQALFTLLEKKRERAQLP